MANVIYQGSKYDLRDPYMEWTRVEAKFVKDKTGLALGEISRQGRLLDPDAICAMLYIAKKRAGEKVRWDDFDDFTMSDIEWVLDDGADEGESEADDTTDERGADPTSAGATQTEGSTPTSPRSRSSSASRRAKSTS